MALSTRGLTEARWLPAASLSAACALWGSAFYFAKIALDELSVIEVLIYRFGLAAPILGAIIYRARTVLGRRDVVWIVVTGILCVPVGYLIHFAGLERTSVTHASLLVGVGPAMLAVTASILGLERVGLKSWTAVGLSTIGVLLMIGLPGGDGDLLGDALVFVSMLVATAWILLSQDLSRRLGASVATAWILLVGTVALVPLAMATGLPPTDLSPRTWGAVAALSLGGTVMAFMLWNWGASRYTAGSAGVFLNLEPVVGVLMGVTLLGEVAGASGLLGGGIILA
ncbi:MAG: DMT family transporter, partial [Gemmatimonadota bacterium]